MIQFIHLSERFAIIFTDLLPVAFLRDIYERRLSLNDAD